MAWNDPVINEHIFWSYSEKLSLRGPNLMTLFKGKAEPYIFFNYLKREWSQLSFDTKGNIKG